MQVQCLPLHGELPEQAIGLDIFACEVNVNTKARVRRIQQLIATIANPDDGRLDAFGYVSFTACISNAPPAPMGRFGEFAGGGSGHWRVGGWPGVVDRSP